MKSKLFLTTALAAAVLASGESYATEITGDITTRQILTSGENVYNSVSANGLNDIGVVGSVIYMGTAGVSANLNNSTVSNSKAQRGVIANYADANLTINGGVISNNAAIQSSTTRASFGGAVITWADTTGAARTTINGTTFSGNFVEDTTNSSRYTSGGAVWSADALVNIKNATFTGNYVKGKEGYGGAVYSQNSDTTITDSVFDGNYNKTTSGSGGAISKAIDSYKFTVTGSSFKNNYTTENDSSGGAASFFGKANVSESIFEKNYTLGETQENGGGAVFLGAESVVAFNKVSFVGNKAEKASGGAIMTRHGNNASNQAAKLDITNSTFKTNTAKWGGAIYNSFYDSISNPSNVTVASSLFEGNIATVSGGAIYNSADKDKSDNGTKIILSDNTFTNNKATSQGGAIWNGGEIIFNGKTVFSGNSDATGTNDIFNTGTIKFNGDVTLDGGISGDTGTVIFANGVNLTVKANETFIKNNVTNNGATLNLNLGNGYTGEYAMVTGTFSGEEFKIAENTLYNITARDGVKGTYDISKKAAKEVAAETGATANQAEAVSAITNGESGNAVFKAVTDNISNMMQSGNPAEVKKALEAAGTFAPDVSPVVLQTASENTNQVFSAVSTRMSGGSAAPRGMSSGDELFDGGAVWAQALYNHAKLDDTSQAKGYKADSDGVAFGFEKQINSDVKAGIGYAYTNTDIDGDHRDLDVDTHTLLAYGEYKPSSWFINGIISYNWSKYDESKNVLGAHIAGDYRAEGYALQTMTGYDIAYNDNTVFTPEAGLRYLSIRQDGYKDTAGQYTYGSRSQALTGVFGVRAEQAYEIENGWVLRPSARLAYTYDLSNDEGNSSAMLANGTVYNVKGEPLKRSGMEADFALTADIDENISISVGYQGKFRDHYEDHTGMLNFKYNF